VFVYVYYGAGDSTMFEQHVQLVELSKQEIEAAGVSDV
jgi:hypothetical protein